MIVIRSKYNHRPGITLQIGGFFVRFHQTHFVLLTHMDIVCLYHILIFFQYKHLCIIYKLYWWYMYFPHTHISWGIYLFLCLILLYNINQNLWIKTICITSWHKVKLIWYHQLTPKSIKTIQNSKILNDSVYRFHFIVLIYLD